MSNNDDSPFASWYNEGKPLPVCHPIPHCSATVHFPAEDVIVWQVIDHKNEAISTERFTLEAAEKHGHSPHFQTDEEDVWADDPDAEKFRGEDDG